MASQLFGLICFCAFVSYLGVIRAEGTAFIFEVTDNERFCLWETFEGAKRYVLEYRVLRGGNHDIDAYVKSPNQMIIYSKYQQKQGTFTFESSKGEFSFCFGNEFSTVSHKFVHFSLRPEDLDSLSGEAGIRVPFVKTVSESLCEDIHESMTSVVRFQRDYKLKESIGRHLAEGLNTRVVWWSIGQALVILVTGVGQVFILKRFFTEKESSVI